MTKKQPTVLENLDRLSVRNKKVKHTIIRMPMDRWEALTKLRKARKIPCNKLITLAVDDLLVKAMPGVKLERI